MPRKKKVKKVVVPATVEIGTPNIVEAPGGLRRFFRFSQLATGQAGGVRNIEDIWATVLQELEDAGVPQEARSRLKDIGARAAFKDTTRLEGAISKLAGGKENVAIIKETLAAGRAATVGFSEAELATQVKSALDLLAKEPAMDSDDGRRIIAELRKAKPSAIAKASVNQTISALSSRGDDPFVVSMYRKVLKKSSTARLPVSIEETLSKVSGGALPKVTTATRTALAGEVAGVGTAASAARKGLGFLGKSALGAAGLAAGVFFEGKRALDILGRGERAKKQAFKGFEELGASSNVGYLRDTVRQQEAVARRKMVMQQFEPELFQDIIRTLNDTGPSRETLTSTERRIGAEARVGGKQQGRSPEDVEFLLDQLFRQMG